MERHTGVIVSPLTPFEESSHVEFKISVKYILL